MKATPSCPCEAGGNWNGVHEAGCERAARMTKQPSAEELRDALVRDLVNLTGETAAQPEWLGSRIQRIIVAVRFEADHHWDEAMSIAGYNGQQEEDLREIMKEVRAAHAEGVPLCCREAHDKAYAQGVHDANQGDPDREDLAIAAKVRKIADTPFHGFRDYARWVLDTVRAELEGGEDG